MEEDDLILAQPMACLNLEVPLLQCLLVLSFVSGTGFSFLPCPAPLPSYEGLSTQWCSVFYHHLGTQQNDRMCLVGEAANFRKVLVQVHLTCQGFFLPLHVQLKSAEHPRMSESTNLKDLEVVFREPE
jgi:hypothetical protein